jgi:hypothetical protein
MNPTNKETPGIPVPMPAEQAGAVPGGLPGETAARPGEQPVINTEKALIPGLQPPAVLPTTIPLPVPSAMAAAVPAGQPAIPVPNPALLADDDKDLIEKEWVDKAKQIVERTRDDPYKQSEELTVFKADYIKKRYGKTIKVSH